MCLAVHASAKWLRRLGFGPASQLQFASGMRPVPLFLLIAACGASAARTDLRVIDFHGATPIEITFDRPVGGPIEVRITPDLPARAWWSDANQLEIEPTAPLSPSTRYDVALVGQLGERTHHFHFSFVHRPLVVEGVWGADPDALAPDGDVPLSFDQPVRAADAAAHCRLAGDRTVALVAHGDATATTIALTPAERLVPGARYTLTCDGLAGAGGNAPLPRPYTLAVRARPTLSLARFSPEGEVAPDEVTIAFSFTTPVDESAVRAAVSATPAIPGLDRGTLSTDGLTYQVTTDLDASTTYSLAVRGLADRYGQRIAAPALATLKTGAAQPRLSVTAGLQVVGSDGLSVWSRDVASFTVDCAPIPRDKLIAVLAGGELPAHPHIYTLAARSTWQRTAVDPAEACGQPAGTRGIYLANIHADAAGGERVIANATDLGVVVEPGVAWVTSLATGMPVEGARVTLVTPAGVPVAADLTNADGLVKLPPLPHVIAIVDRGGDVAVAETGTWNIAGALPGPHTDEPVPAEPPPAEPPPSAFHVTLEPHVADPAPGARLVFELAAEAPDAQVEWTLRTRRHALAFDGFAFGTEADAGDVTADGTGTTDAQGHLTIVTRDPATPVYPVDYIVTATVRDAAERTSTATAQVTAHPTPLYVGARVSEQVLPVGAPFEVELAAFEPSGMRRAAAAVLTLSRVERTCTARGCDDHETVLEERAADLPERGHHVEQLAPDAPGVYRVRVSADDAMPLALDLHVTGPGETGYAGDGLVASKPVYHAGDTARLALGAELPEPTILLTLEHGGTVDARVFHLASTAEGLEIVIARSWAPAVTASVLVLSGGPHPRVATATTTLHVE
jgi:hypothetical protein